MTYKLISILMFIFVSNNIFGQNCLQAQLNNIEYINNSNMNFPEQIVEDDKILLNRLFEKEKLCNELDHIRYIYVSHFQTSGYSYTTSSVSHKVFFFNENMELISLYSGHIKDLTKRLDISLLIQRNEYIKESNIIYIQAVLKQVAENNVKNIEKEENELTSGCNCVNYESIYYLTPYKTKVYFFDLYYKKLFNGDFYENFQKEIDDYINELK